MNALIKPDPSEWRTLRIGMKGEDVEGWQRVLTQHGYDLSPWGVDGDFGPLTEKRTIRFQLDRGLTPDGIVGPQTRANILTGPKFRVHDGSPTQRWPFVQAATWRWLNRPTCRLVVMHTMEAAEKPYTAEAVAAWFAGQRGKPPRASAHACIDSDSVVLCVRPEHGAAAAPGSNRDGYHIELAGRAAQDAAGWADDYSQAMLALAAEHAAEIALMFDIPPVRLTLDQVEDRQTKGFCGHHAVSLAFRKSTHTDPGNAFPWEQFLQQVAACMEARRA